MRKLPRTKERGTNQFVDPEYAPTVEEFDNLSHAEIHKKVQLMDPSVLTAGQQAWHGSATGLAEAVTDAHTEIRSAIADGWRGAAAEKAVAAVRSFEESGQRLADVMATVAQRLGQAGDAAEALRAAVPQPHSARPDLSAALLNPSAATANAGIQKSAESARQDVVRAMDTIYASAFIPTGTGVPAFADETLSPAGQPSTGEKRTIAENPATQTVSLISGTQPGETPVVAAPEPQADRPATVTATQPTATTETTPASAASAIDPARPAAADPATVPATARTAPSTSTVPTTVAMTETVAPQPVSSTGPSAATPTEAQPAFTATRATSTSADEKRKRDERQRDSDSNSTTDTVTGVGAGAVGGLMGGAFAASEAPPRSGPSVAATAARAARAEDEDDELHWIDDDLDYLEPADESTELIGALDPTTPPVLGEWTELE